MFKHSIFLRIYAGLVILVVLVAVFGYLLVQIINYQRAQEYRESLTDGISYVISEGVARQPGKQQKIDWVSDASDLLELPIYYTDASKVELSRTEKKRIEAQKSVVRYDASNSIAYIIIGLRDDPQHYLSIKVDKISERQMKALPIFVLDYLMFYPGQEQEYLAKIQKHFSYPINIYNIQDVNLDSEQIGRLRQDQSVMLYKDSATMRGTTISIVSPIPNHPAQVLVLGPVPMFNWMPLQLSAGITLFSLFLLSLGVYGLILPLERKIRQVRYALNRMKSGDLSLRVPIEGSDEMANLASSYNNMSDHIQRLIEAQRELMRAVSHELRTPVARIRFGTEMLAEEDDYNHRMHQVDMIDKDIEALNTLIDEIMTYAKLEQGTPSLDFAEIALFDVLDQVAVETEALKTQKEIELVAPPVYLKVDAERRYLHRVVQNLVGNAVRYCDNKVRITGGVHSDGMAFVCVEDDGAGIPEQDRQRVFEAFARLDDSRTRASGGYGLGLSIVSRIAYWFGGEIKVDESPTLGGARFIMTWPAKRFKQPPLKANKKAPS
ncbi:adaptive-response sensory-kinase SasA [Acinetobacter calcoaceticus]|uniref:histidine kinase n=1 Tax=Acinetobacter calcoaceticus TaxID=471 RepID=A0ABD5AQR5_ACICA|nr:MULTISPECIES: sensor histidine kinase BfmS [Acinetobacter]KQQ69470.1 histidine kinase [Acinetobacter sp. Leaf130]MBP2605456.1 two-component system sensor histidine kinase RstB [Acinetobacter calcoaceticus]MDP9804840.1 two-component system sensor histidine kinase RstB [Acinetobacter calcoaceticus]MDR6797832.1 two-component system sensor histidine kinase RstB [Acinetobacter calcoaceticus]UGQ25640.1 sensor histidine kinase BfmS [Acinetobacter calcoaceticus]